MNYSARFEDTRIVVYAKKLASVNDEEGGGEIDLEVVIDTTTNTRAWHCSSSIHHDEQWLSEVIMPL